MARLHEIRDPIYGFVSFNDWEKQIINHSAFQRLRRIRQLAFTDMVYPGGNYTRFEHSIGVMHLATLMYEAIVEDDANKNLLEEYLSYDDAGLKRDKQLIRLTALLHDIGHAPFSHASEDVMPLNDKAKKPYKHEDYSSAVITGPLRTVIEDHQINKSNYKISADEVAALLEGNVSILEGKLFWKVIISSQLDADRGDYLLRDSHHIGVKYGVYDYSRLLNTLALGVDPESNDLILGVHEDGWHVAESLVIARYQMFTQVYFHKTRRAYDYHLKEAMKKILKHGKLPAPQKIEKFLEFDDMRILQDAKSHRNDLNCKALLDRNHLKVAFATAEMPTEEDEQKLEAVKKRLMDNSIWFYEDKATSGLWYKLDTEEESKEVMIIKGLNRKASPLSNYSSIVKNMGEVKQIRVYVRPEDRDKALGVLR
ncbi:MAG: HD domain-containing protein [Actinobacteria bacterium]|nr:HD domain-containing protein [Actinomycetota bacterium]